MHECASHYADIYLAKFENESLDKATLKLSSILSVYRWYIYSMAQGEKDDLNNRELPVWFKATNNKQMIRLLDTTIFSSENEKRLTKVSQISRFSESV